jgi:hypothetical protein
VWCTVYCTQQLRDISAIAWSLYESGVFLYSSIFLINALAIDFRILQQMSQLVAVIDQYRVKWNSCDRQLLSWTWCIFAHNLTQTHNELCTSPSTFTLNSAHFLFFVPNIWYIHWNLTFKVLSLKLKISSSFHTLGLSLYPFLYILLNSLNMQMRGFYSYTVIFYNPPVPDSYVSACVVKAW